MYIRACACLQGWYISSLLQCVAVCGSILQFDEVFTYQFVCVCAGLILDEFVAEYRSILQCVAVLQCVYTSS